jgi:hypothetical protein
MRWVEDNDDGSCGSSVVRRHLHVLSDAGQHVRVGHHPMWGEEEAASLRPS